MAKLETRRKIMRSFEAKALKSRSFMTQLADEMTKSTGSPSFLFFNIVFFATWIIINTNLLPGIVPFDPYPFGFLTMIVSLEAIILSIFVLVSQNRSDYINTLRQEVQMQVNMIAEEEITKILEILSDMRKKMGVTKQDPILDKMLETTDTGYIERSIIGQLERANKPLWDQIIRDFPDLIRGNNGNNKPAEEAKPAVLANAAQKTT